MTRPATTAQETTIHALPSTNSSDVSPRRVSEQRKTALQRRPVSSQWKPPRLLR